MSKIIVLVAIIFACIYFCSGLEKYVEFDLDPELIDDIKSIKDKAKHNFEPKRDKTTDTETELRHLRKTKKTKERFYRNVLENLLPENNNEEYKIFFENLLKNSSETLKIDLDKNIDDVVVTDTFVNNYVDTKGLNPQVEDIEVVIEHISNTSYNNETDKQNMETTTMAFPESNFKHSENVSFPESINQEELPTVSNEHLVLSTKGRSGMNVGRSTERDLSLLEPKKIYEPYPISRNTVMPKYRTRSTMMVAPALYALQSTAPLVDYVTTHNRVPNTAIAPKYFAQSASRINRPEVTSKVIDEYIDYRSNSYLYAPGRSKETTKLPEISRQAYVTNPIPFRDYTYPAPNFSRAQPIYYSDGYRPWFGFHG